MSVPVPMPVHAWVFPARCVGVMDGDTIEVEIDTTFRSTHKVRLRIRNAYAPELEGGRNPAGVAARDFTDEWLANAGISNWPLIVRTYRSRSNYDLMTFERYVADVWRLNDGASLAADLIAAGHATATDD
jgi:endonuclease YncB( thermonuclease family)